MKRGWIASFALTFALAVTGVAEAAPSPADEARRTKLFEDAKKLADEGRWGEAALPLREVIQIRSAPKALIALAVVERELLHLLEAKALLERAAAEAASAKLDADEKRAHGLLDELTPLIPRVELVGAERHAGLTVYVDDTATALVEGRFVLVDPGKHTLRIEAPGAPPQRAPISAEARQRLTVTVALEPVASNGAAGDRPPTPTTPTPDESGVRGSLVGAIVTGSGGIAVGVVGSVLMALGAADQSDAEKQCGGTENCSPSLQPQVDEGATNIVVGDVLAGVGGAALTGGVIWLIVELASPQERTARAIEPRLGGLTLRF